MVMILRRSWRTGEGIGDDGWMVRVSKVGVWSNYADLEWPILNEYEKSRRDFV